MRVKFSSKGNILTAKIIGELDHHTAEYIREKIDAEIVKASTKHLVLDFTDTTFMDSSGIGVIMGRYKNISKFNGKTVLSANKKQIIKIIEMAGITNIIPLFKNPQDAVDSLLSND